MATMENIGGTGENSQIVRCVVIGDQRVGKSNLILSFAQGIFNTEYVPTVFDHYSCEVNVEGTGTKLEFWDMSGSEEH